MIDAVQNLPGVPVLDGGMKEQAGRYSDRTQQTHQQGLHNPRHSKQNLNFDDNLPVFTPPVLPNNLLRVSSGMGY